MKYNIKFMSERLTHLVDSSFTQHVAGIAAKYSDSEFYFQMLTVTMAN